jgi:hypothetical protein
MKKLQFINHASYLFECDDFIFICDPWLEGTAFNEGWALLDDSTSNDQLIDKVFSCEKQIFIWYSHEHSDHFAIPFLRKLKSKRPDTKFFFQNTEDDRVVSYLKTNQFECTVINDGDVVHFNSISWLSIRSWRSGDSYSVIDFDGFSILNLNDCIITSDSDCQLIKLSLDELNIKNLNVLFTQFGYASWCGNEKDSNLRVEEADEKLKRIATQVNTLNPENTILFASFVYFANDFNFYLNDSQNTPVTVRASNHLKPISNKIYFMKPWDIVNLDATLPVQLKSITSIAEKHWQAKYESVEPSVNKQSASSIPELIEEFNRYRALTHRTFVGLFWLIEAVGIIKPLTVKVLDIDRSIRLSYINGASESKEDSQWDIAMNSSDLSFSVTENFGFDCVHVNGRFRTSSSTSNTKFLYFAGPQNMLKNGFGWKRPLPTIKEFLRLARR